MSGKLKLPKIINKVDKTNSSKKLLSLPNINCLKISSENNIRSYVTTYEDIKRYLNNLQKN